MPPSKTVVEMKNRPLTDDERRAVLVGLMPPTGGWASIYSEKARLEQRWHAFIEKGLARKQDMVTGLIETIGVANRKARRANAAQRRRTG